MLKRKLGPLLYGVLFLGKRVTLLAESTLAMFSERLHEKTLTLCLSQELTTALAHTLIVLTELTRLGQQKCFYHMTRRALRAISLVNHVKEKTPLRVRYLLEKRAE